VEKSIIQSLGSQVLVLFVLAIPVACISWTITHEEIFREAREFCVNRSQNCKLLLQRKFFYVFTCEYCFSHYVTAVMLFVTRFTMVFDSWRGYLIAGFSLVWVANFYMAVFGRLRLELKSQRLEIEQEEKEGEEKTGRAPARIGR
jgi:cytochrome c oxidase assembly factor CtaG